MSISLNNFLGKIKKSLLKNYPDGEFSDRLLKMFKFDIKEDVSIAPSKSHETVELKHNSGNVYDIDKNIAKLIKYIWMCGINTISSCENNVPKDYIWIQFATTDDLRNFLNIVFKNEKVSDIIDNRKCTPFSYEYKDSWIYTVNIDEDDYDSPKINNLFLTISLRFPNTDYDWVCSKLEKYLVNRNKK